MKKFGIRILLAAILVTLISVVNVPANSVSALTLDKKHAAVVIDIDDGINYVVRKKFDGSGAIVKPKQENTYVLAKGLYSLCIKQEGYYQSKQAFFVSSADLKKEKVIQADPQLLAGRGNEPTGEFFRWNPEVEQNFYSDDVAAGEPIDTPSLDPAKAANEYVNSDERIAYLADAVAKSDNLYMFFIDEKTPVIFFTSEDLNGAGSLEEAAEIFAASDKLKMYLQCEIHGNEPAGGEAGMYFVSRLAGQLGESIKPNMDMYITPCLNTSGHEAFARINEDGIDMNRDNIQVKSAKMRAVHGLFNIIMPEVAVDCHESHYEDIVSSAGRISHLDDVKVRGIENTNTAADIRNITAQFTEDAIADGNEAGLRTYYYNSSVNSTTSRGYYGLYNTCSMIIESIGLRSGKDHLARRVYSQYVVTKSLVENVAENAASIKEMVAADRAQVVEKGKVYSKSNKFVLKHGLGLTLKSYRPVVNIYGNVVSNGQVGKRSYSKVLKTRALPTAYVIPKNAKNAEAVATALRYNGVQVLELREGTAIKVAQTSGKRSAAKVGRAKNKVFADGAYAIPMDQVGAKLAAASLEPDVYDSNKENKTETLSYMMNIKDLFRYFDANPTESLSEWL